MKSVILSIYFILFLFLNVGAQHSVRDNSLLTSDTEEFTKLLEVYKTLLRQKPNEAAKYLRKADSLSNVIQDIKNKMTLHFAKADYFMFTVKYDSVIYNYQQGYLIAKNHGNNHDRLTALVGLARGYSNKNEHVKSDSLAQIALKIAIKEPVDSLNLALIYGVLANKEFAAENILESLEFEQKSLLYNQTDTVSRILTYLRIGSLHSKRRNYEKDKFYADEALALSQKIRDTKSLALSHRALGSNAFHFENYEEALSHFELSTSYFEQLGLKNELPNIFYFQARIFLKTNESNKAIEKYNAALKELEKEGDEMGTAYTFYELGKVYSSLKDYTKAESYFLKAKTKFEALKMNPMQSYIQLRLSQMYAAQKDFKNAYSSHVEFKRLDDSVFYSKKSFFLADAEEKYQNKQKQQEIELLNAKNEIAQLEIDKQTNLRNYFILAAILLALLIAVIYNRYQLKNKANAKLKELDTVKTNFFTNISHEFRTPLTLILSPLQQLRKEELNKDALDSLDIIQQNATRLTDLTNQLLELSKLEAGSLELVISEDNLNKFLHVICASFESLAYAQNIRLITELNDVPDLAYFDGDKVQKIINNLLSNAFKFTSTEGEVAITAKQQGTRLAIAVSDTGKGISEEDQKQLFNRFYQSRSNTVHTAGTGVGLTLAKELAQLHKGDITINSAEGKGATFTFEFPFDKASYANEYLISPSATSKIEPRQRATRVIDTNVEATDESKTQILVVEDNPDLRAHISNLLKDNYKVLNAINGKKGLELAIKAVPDLIITDLMMPEMDGIQLNEAVKNNENTSHIPVILLTAKADRDTKLESLKTGADDFLVKPFDNEELFIRVENMISQRQKLQEKYAQTLTLSPSKITIQSKEEAFLKKALELVDANIANPEFTVERFQKEIGMSRMQLHRKLKALTNFSSSEFIRDVRLQRAADLLAGNNLNVSEVAYSCGFNSVSYFTQCFTQKFGVNPSKYSS